MSVPAFQGGGFNVSSDIGFDTGAASCAGFYRTGTTHEAIDNAVSLDCQEQ